MLRKRLFISGIGSILTILLVMYVFCYYLPQTEMDIKGRMEMLEKVTNQVNEARAYQQQYDDAEKHEKELMVKEQYLRYRIPDKIIAGKVMAELQNTAQIKNVEIVSIVPEVKEEYDGYASQSFLVIVRGSFFTLLQFARGLEECKQFMHVDSIGITGKGENVECRIGLKVYSAN